MHNTNETLLGEWWCSGKLDSGDDGSDRDVMVAFRTGT